MTSLCLKNKVTYDGSQLKRTLIQLTGVPFIREVLDLNICDLGKYLGKWKYEWKLMDLCTHRKY